MPQARITQRQREQIIALYDKRESQPDIARRLGLTLSTVRRAIRHHRSWPHQADEVWTCANCGSRNTLDDCLVCIARHRKNRERDNARTARRRRHGNV